MSKNLLTKKNVMIEGATNNIAAFEAWLQMASITFDVTITVGDVTKAQTKTAEPKAQKTTKAKTSSKKKSDDNFDRALYESIAKELGCYGKHGCYKACRPTVYKVMDGTLTKAKAKKEVEAFKKQNAWAK